MRVTWFSLIGLLALSRSVAGLQVGTPHTSTAEIIVGSAVAGPDRTATIAVSLRDGTGQGVVGMQNDIILPLGVRAALRANGRPDCMRNPDFNVVPASFTLRPVGCTPSIDCGSLRGILFAADSTEPFPNGLLYQCRMLVLDNACPGTHRLACAEPSAVHPTGLRLPASCVDGELLVPTGPGDCDVDGHVTIDEVLSGVAIALGESSLANCETLDVTGDGAVTIEELVIARNLALHCP